jgi:hypothetical protein
VSIQRREAVAGEKNAGWGTDVRACAVVAVVVVGKVDVVVVER